MVVYRSPIAEAALRDLMSDVSVLVSGFHVLVCNASGVDSEAAAPVQQTALAPFAALFIAPVN